MKTTERNVWMKVVFMFIHALCCFSLSSSALFHAANVSSLLYCLSTSHLNNLVLFSTSSPPLQKSLLSVHWYEEVKIPRLGLNNKQDEVDLTGGEAGISCLSWEQRKWGQNTEAGFLVAAESLWKQCAGCYVINGAISCYSTAAHSAICSDDKQRNRYGAESRRSAAVQPVNH